MRMKKKLALLLSAAMLVTSINLTPFTAFAANNPNGTADTPANGSTKLTLDFSADKGYNEKNASGSTELTLVIASHDLHTHVKGTKHEAVDATCVVAGTKEYYECTSCDAKLDASSAVIEEITVPINPDNHDMAEATCTTPATCKREGCTYTEGKALGHSFNTEKWESDETDHWHPAICGHTTEKDAVEKHIYGETGEDRYTCTVCKYVDTEKKTGADNTDAVKAVEEKIDAIGSVEYTQECKEKIDTARAAYDGLADDQKNLVKNYAELIEAETEYDALKDAADKAAEDNAAANAVVDKINAIGKVEYSESSKGKIEEARRAYDALTADQKKLVTEAQLKVLTDAEAEYANLKEAADKKAADEQAADEVIAKIEAIGNVEYTQECKEKIDAARAAYDGLTDDQKNLITNYAVLAEAEEKYDRLKEESDKDSGDGKYEDVSPSTGEVKDITGTLEAPAETNPFGAAIENNKELETLVDVTPEEKEQGVNVWLEVVDASATMSEEDKEKIENASGDNSIGIFLDISLFKKVGNNEASKVTELSGKMKISFVVPEELRKDGRIYEIIRVHDGVATVIEGTYDSATYTFETDQFSSYALVYKDKQESVPSTPVKPVWQSWFDKFKDWWENQGQECDHEYTSVVTDSTCEEKGYTTHTCTKCGDSYKDSYTDALGHNYEDGVCTRCGKKEPSSIPNTPIKPGKPNWGFIWDIFKCWK